ncbi:hypothetical protein LTR10_017204 [Elasticomyces elasticus]|uniref:Annexin n=1 Tax=Exophiala sideris TaxID=1016849 RepID=A0ABR0J5X1_9EURO|nr:hypothetical protein LTR10_017204 [Elasticomyces elasticus]KAK5028440.1 hypothetical protein LTS07_006531 [Exophiala sideris]KAK5035917.1 hypothetical protein LTR13_005487 [Exophiala sideris]KAK5056953.1 hypothetical protein LTR69_007591 [Exophiala sideris]KAK5181360.1 hypothetical protein LTR44_006155 [Eurotiomycetes sp. CCFEE 6388]
MLSVRDERRSRSKSPGGRDRDRSRSHSRDNRGSDVRSEYTRSSKKYVAAEPESESEDDRRYKEKKSSKKYYESEEEDDRRRRTTTSKKYVEDSEEGDRYRSTRTEKEYRRREVSVSDDDRRYERSKKKSDSDSDRRRERDRHNRKKYDDSDDSDADNHRRPSNSRDLKGQNGRDPRSDYTEVRPREVRHSSYTGSDSRYAAPDRAPSPPTQRTNSYTSSRGQKYAEVEQFKYAQPSEFSEKRPEYERSRPSDTRRRDDGHRSDKHGSREKDYREDRYETREHRDKKYYEDKYGSSPETVTKRMSSLAVGGGLGATLGVAGAAAHGAGGKPPASPLLEAYKGTYQSISPMPSALVLADHKDDSDLSDLELDLDDDPNADLRRKIRKLEMEKEKYAKDQRRGVNLTPIETRPRRTSQLESVTETTTIEIRPGMRRERSSSSVSILSPGGSGKKKSVSFYDPTDDAKRIATALSGTRNAPDPRPLIHILPFLSTDDLLALRAEYKKHAKVNGQGINIAKHIKTRITGNLGKAAYTTALGRWESEAYWANSWYQGGASRRELLIESLMGRSNSDIREIKNCFKDKKYNDDLEKCIRTELKADKFRMAILLALEERRMPESSPIDIKLVRSDVDSLAMALESSGGESDMIKIIVLRSDAHLREALRLFERTYRVSFPRQMILKSRNLVGETLAHVLNGALNRPMRDALLLHQAISETAPGKERTELLISRLVRMHWEPKHLQRVKSVYKERYGHTVEEAIKTEVWAQMKTTEGRFCAEFCAALGESSSFERRGVPMDMPPELR